MPKEISKEKQPKVNKLRIYITAEDSLPCDHAGNNVILCNANVSKVFWLDSPAEKIEKS